MNLYSDFSAAYESLFRRYIKSKKEQLFYMITAKIGRRGFFTVLSAEEAKKYKISVKNCELVIGKTEKQKENRREYQEYIHSDEGQKALLYRNYVALTRREQRMRKEIDQRLESEDI